MNNLVCKLSSSDPVSKISNKKMKWMEKYFLPVRWKETLSFQALNKELLCVCSTGEKGGRYLWAKSAEKKREREHWGRTSLLPEWEWISDRLMHFPRKTHRCLEVPTVTQGATKLRMCENQALIEKVMATAQCCLLTPPPTHQIRNHLKCTCRLSPITDSGSQLSSNWGNKNREVRKTF